MAEQEFIDRVFKSLHFVGSLESVPDYAISLANIVTTWTALEQRFTVAYMLMAGCTIEVASITMHTLSNSHQKFTMLRSFAKQSDMDRKFRKTLIELVEEAQQLAKKRSKYVHRQWIVRGDGQVQLINYAETDSSQKRTEIIQLARMKSVVDDTLKLHQRMDNLMNPFLQPKS